MLVFLCSYCDMLYLSSIDYSSFQSLSDCLFIVRGSPFAMDCDVKYTQCPKYCIHDLNFTQLSQMLLLKGFLLYIT